MVPTIQNFEKRMAAVKCAQTSRKNHELIKPKSRFNLLYFFWGKNCWKTEWFQRIYIIYLYLNKSIML